MVKLFISMTLIVVLLAAAVVFSNTMKKKEAMSRQTQILDENIQQQSVPQP